MKKYCIYIRVSTQKQGRSGLGLEAQMKICTDYIKSVGGEVSGIYKDIDHGTVRNRQGLADAVNLCKSTGDTLVIAKLDRFARDVEFTFMAVNNAKDKKGNPIFDIHFCDMPVINTMTLGVNATMAQYERELISERTKAALAAKKAQGYKLGRPKGVDLSKANEASAKVRREKAKNNPNNKIIWGVIGMNGVPTAEDLQRMSVQLNQMGVQTASKLDFTPERVRTAYHNMKKYMQNS
ncbi:MAG: recombinase family protein [Prevotella sp.]|nr:recombinase family protein [Prevotella sp.]